MKDTNKLFYLLLFVLALAVNFAGINVNFFTDDPGLYAAIAKTLLYKKDFFELYTYNQDWLDKPHFPFWMVLASFKLFGVSVWAYRLPALLFFTLSLVYTWLLARKYYGWQVAFAAVMILMTAMQVLLSNTDTRAEPYLMALIPGAIYHIAKLHERYSFGQLLMAALLTACAVMTKGIFVIIAIYGALLGQLIFQKQFKQVFKLKWPALGVLTIIFILPELYALYTQFDLHPERTVFGRHNVSGIKWFLWDSQFGRFINSGPISRAETGSKFFYLHTLLWAFAPWCLVFYYAIFKNIKQIVGGKKLAEYYTISGGLLLLLLFSLSGFQLPFYT
ncbi:MAG: glycosyltransferase family 39 protein, partial [Mucilaginibacter sp.]